MASLGSSIRSAARATSSAYRRLPIRWRLAGGSAALTLVILCGFAAIVGVLTTRQIQRGLQPRGLRRGRPALGRGQAAARPARPTAPPTCARSAAPASTTTPAARTPPCGSSRSSGELVMGSEGAPSFGPYIAPTANVDGWRVESRRGRGRSATPTRWSSSTRSGISEVEATANRVKVFLAFGVLGGGLLALLAGLATARRAMEPIAEMTAAAREVERSRDPTVRIPRPTPRTRSPSSRARSSRCSRRSARRARRPRPRWPASASSSPTPRTSCARR